MKIRPLRDLVLVKSRPDITHECTYGRITLALPKRRRAGSFYCAEVIAVGPEAHPDVLPGKVVMVEIMSGPEGGANLDASGFGLSSGDRVAFAHCRLLAPGGEIDHMARTATIEVDALTKELKERKANLPMGVSGSDERIRFLEARIERLKHEMAEMFARRKGRGRSRAFKPIRDPGQASGILAVLDV